MRIEFFGHSYIGKKREFNEDSFLCADFSGNHAGPPQPLYLFAVADGIGGHAGGEVASRLAIRTLNDNLAQRLGQGGPGLDLKNILEDSFHQANRKIFREGAEAERLAGMGTTLVAALITAKLATVANVGDSRLYLIRGNTPVQISQDHSWAAEQVRRKLLSEKEVGRSPFRNLVTRSLGYGPEIDVDSFRVPLLDGDWLLLCTDGLYGPLPERVLVKFFKKAGRPEDACRALIKAADKKGSQDNITAVVVSVREA
jgi:protein phosphatase